MRAASLANVSKIDGRMEFQDELVMSNSGLTVFCPVCGAKLGKRCKSEHGVEARRSHHERVGLAKDMVRKKFRRSVERILLEVGKVVSS